MKSGQIIRAQVKYTVMLGRAGGVTWYAVETDDADAWVEEHVKPGEHCAMWPARDGDEHYPAFPG